MDSRDHVVFGALFHDIGKFFERAERLGDYRNQDDRKQQDCRWNPEGRYWSHLHVLHTRRFCEVLCEHAPLLTPPTSQTSATADQHWINLAARHHTPSTPLERLVVTADHFASGEREQGRYYEQNIHKRTRLESLLERVDLNGKNRATRHRLPLSPLKLHQEAIFPIQADAFSPPMTETALQRDNNELNSWISPKPLIAEYQTLADGFLEALRHLPQYRRDTPEGLRSLATTILAQMERYMNAVPAATNVLHPDISLYDHLRVTAAIAEGLFLHHQAQGTLDKPELFSDRKTAKWRLVCGDFSGIQKFIYNITRKGAAKGLRGRSLYIQLLCDGVAEHLLRRLDLYPTARIYSSGGKFYLLIPDCLEQKLCDETASINAELIKAFQGEIFLGLGIAPVCSDDFSGGNMGRRWKEANESLLQDRLQRFRPLLEDDIEFFAPQTLSPGQACGVCGRDDAQAEIGKLDSGPICRQCGNLQNLGKELKNTKALFWVWKNDLKTASERLKNALCFELPGTGWTLFLLKQEPSFTDLHDLTASHLEQLNDINDPDGNPNGYSCGFRLVGKWQADKQGEDWEFDDFDKNAKGIKRFGVLRLDVDNLGEVFIRGLKFPGATGQEQEMGSLSRVATLSRQLHLFFAGYLTTLLTPFKRTQIIYAGGDDVFLIGSWDELPKVAHSIREKFQAYCAHNPHFTISGGIVLVDGKYPISRAADMAGDAESQAKRLKRASSEKESRKDAISFLETAIGWEEYPAAEAMREQLTSIIDKTHNRAILERLRSVVLAAEEFRRLCANQSLKDIEIRELVHWQQWRWRLVYNLKRMAKRNPDIKTELDTLVEKITDSRAPQERTVLDWLQLPTRWAEFLTRRQDREFT